MKRIIPCLFLFVVFLAPECIYAQSDPVRRLLIEGDYSVLEIGSLFSLYKNVLSELSAEQLRVARNTVYAKHGYRFKSKDLNEHFRRFSWYDPRYSNVEQFFTFRDRCVISHILQLEGKDWISPLSIQDMAQILTGFWADMYPPPEAVGGFTFHPDQSFEYETWFSKEGSSGTWKIEGTKILILTDRLWHWRDEFVQGTFGPEPGEGNEKIFVEPESEEWETIGDFQTLRFPSRNDHGLVPEVLNLTGHLCFKLHGARAY